MHLKELNISRWKKKTVVKYPKLCAAMDATFQAFPSAYIVQSEFGFVHY